jgi:hypothetical protein
VSVPSSCKQFEKQVNSLKTQLATAQKNLQQQKGSTFAVETVQDLLQKLLDTQKKLTECIQKASGEVSPKPHPFSGKPFSNPCLSLKNRADAIATRLRHAQENLQSSHHAQNWVDEVKALLKEKLTADGQYADCLSSHHSQPGLTCTLGGDAKMTTDYKKASGPFHGFAQGSSRPHRHLIR